MFAVLFFDNNKTVAKMPKSMPNPKKNVQLIDNELAKKCKMFITKEDKIAISKNLDFSVGYIDMVINGSRFNKKIISSLSRIINRKISKLKL